MGRKPCGRHPPELRVYRTARVPRRRGTSTEAPGHPDGLSRTLIPRRYLGNRAPAKNRFAPNRGGCTAVQRPVPHRRAARRRPGKPSHEKSAGPKSARAAPREAPGTTRAAPARGTSRSRPCRLPQLDQPRGERQPARRSHRILWRDPGRGRGGGQDRHSSHRPRGPRDVPGRRHRVRRSKQASHPRRRPSVLPTGASFGVWQLLS